MVVVIVANPNPTALRSNSTVSHGASPTLMRNLPTVPAVFAFVIAVVIAVSTAF